MKRRIGRERTDIPIVHADVGLDLKRRLVEVAHREDRSLARVVTALLWRGLRLYERDDILIDRGGKS